MMSFIAFLAMGAVEGPETIHTEKIEARVGNQIITTSDILHKEQQLQTQYRELTEQELSRKAIEELIQADLRSQFLEERDAQVTNQEVERQIQQMFRAQGISRPDQYQMILQREGISLQEFRQRIRKQLETQRFMQIAQQQMDSEISEEELQEYYHENADQFDQNFELVLYECTIQQQPNQEQNAANIAAKFEEDPENFRHCVNDFSKAPSARQGGKLGTFQRGDLREDLEEKVFAADENEVIRIERPMAIQLILVQNKKDLGPQNFEEVREDIKRRLQEEKLQRSMEKTLEEYRSSKPSGFIQVKR